MMIETFEEFRAKNESKQMGLKIVGLEIPNGGVCLGSKVKLSNGEYLSGISSITLHADTDTKLWQLTLKTIPDFVDQKVIEALLVDVKTVERENAEQRKENILKQVELLQAEYSLLSGLYEAPKATD